MNIIGCFREGRRTPQGYKIRWIASVSDGREFADSVKEKALAAAQGYVLQQANARRAAAQQGIRALTADEAALFAPRSMGVPLSADPQVRSDEIDALARAGVS